MGAILYRAISGHQVFSGPNLGAVIRSMALDEVTPLSHLVQGVPPELEATIHRCLQRDIEARFQTAEALSEALEPFEALEVEVIPIEQPERTQSLPISSVSGDLVVGPELEPEPEPEPEPPHGREAAPRISAAPVDPQRGDTSSKLVKLVTLMVVAVGLVLGALWLFGQAANDGDEAVAGEQSSETSGPTPLEVAVDSETDETGLAAGGETGEAAGGETGEAETGEAETETGEAEPAETEDTGDSDSEGWVAATERPAPPGTFRAGPYIAPNEPGPNTDLATAKASCDSLASASHAGETGWKLANPAQLAKFIGNPKVKRGRYWTTALNKGHAWTYSMPGGKKSSEKANRKLARPLCVTKY